MAKKPNVTQLQTVYQHDTKLFRPVAANFNKCILPCTDTWSGIVTLNIPIQNEAETHNMKAWFLCDIHVC